MQRIHHLRVCANTAEQIINGNTSCITSQSPSERWASIRMKYIWVCVLTYTCVLTHTYTRVQLSCICDKKRQLQYHHQRKIGGRLVGRRSPPPKNLKILTKILVKISLRSCCKILQDYGTKKFHNLVRSYARSY